MIVVALCVMAVVVFAVASLVSAWWLRRHRSAANAERASRAMHALFFLCLNLVPLILFVEPGITHLDELVGLPPLRNRFLWVALGVVLAIPGLYLLAVTNRALRVRGSGANAFRLTRRVVSADIYERTRNPMSLGFYLWIVAVGLLTGSTAFTLGALFLIVPAHLLFLVCFERLELELRLGPAYEEYRKRTPFLFPRLSAGAK